MSFQKLSAELKKPFPEADIEWRISQAGIKKDGEVWAKCLAYIDNRAIMDRLDAVVGPDNWANEFRPVDGGFICGIGVCIEGKWVWKFDGAQNSEFEPLKGGLSGSMKRAAVQWGIGRYLYNLPEGWAEVSDTGKRQGKTPDKREAGKMVEKGKSFKWNPPKLPKNMLP